MTIYIDIVLLENIIMNYIILYATSLILKIKAKHFRIFLGSVIGAVYSVIGYMSILPMYSNVIVKVILSIIIVYISFNPPKVKQLLKQILFFYFTSFVFGGAAFFLIYFLKPQDILMRNGLFLGSYPLKTVLLGGIIGLVIIIIALKLIKTKMGKKDMYCKIIIKLEGKQIQTTAMIDTGNLLKEPITNLPVVVVEHVLLYDVLPKEILINLENILGGDLEKIPEEIRFKYIPKLKVIPFQSLGKQNGMLLGIKAEEICMQKADENIVKNKVIIGIYNKSFTKKGEYQALLGIDMIE